MSERYSNSKNKNLDQKEINRLLTFSNLPKTYLGHIKKEKIKDLKNSTFSKMKLYKNSKKYFPKIPNFESSFTLRTSNHFFKFSTGARFTNPHSNSTSSNFFHDSRPHKKTPRLYGTMGESERKSLLIKINDNPDPAKYVIKDNFDYNIKKKKGYSLNSYDNRNNLGNLNKIPGPGQYKTKINFWMKKEPCTLKHRPPFYLLDKIKLLTGVSPQKYKIKYQITENNRYNGVGFGYGKKHIINISDNPGPGKYNLPSCFDMKRKKVALN